MNSVAEIMNFQTLHALPPHTESCSRTPRYASMPLLYAPVDTSLRVIGYSAGKGMAHRLASMGITENSIIKITHQAGGNLVIAVGDTRLGIEPGIANKIMVIPVAG